MAEGGLEAPRAALAAMRRARRRTRVANIDAFEAFYRIYLFGLALGVSSYFAAGVGGLVPATGADLAVLSRYGPGVVGLVVSVAVSVGVLSGARGGPLALEAAEIHHVLAAPISRRLTLGIHARSALRRSFYFGAVGGGLCGMVALRRLPGSPGVWLAVAALASALAAVASSGAAMVVAGWGIRPSLASLLAVVVVGWSAVDSWLGIITSPSSLLGAMALWPVRHPPLVVVLLGPVAAVVLALSGLAAVGGTDIEALALRSSLVGALRYAAAARDVRSVALLRRQLNFERPRSSPYFHRRPGGGAAAAVLGRDIAGALRWPLRRLVRMGALGAAVVACLLAAWRISLPIGVLAAVFLWLISLEASEGLGQEIDHPSLTALVPRPSGWLYLRHLVVPFALVAAVLCVAVAMAAALSGSQEVAMIGGVALLPAVACGLSAAAVSIVRPQGADVRLLGMSEVAGAYVLVRELLPLGIAFLGVLPVLMGANAAHSGAFGLDSEIYGASVVLLAPAATVGWLQANGRVQGEMEDA